MFHPLRISAVEQLTDDSVAVTFEVPPELRETFRHTPGQHLALRRTVDGEEIRRTYSICAAASPADEDPVLRVGIRLVDGGEFSTYALKELAVGRHRRGDASHGPLPPRAASPGTSPRSSAAAGSHRCCRWRRRCWRVSRRPGSV